MTPTPISLMNRCCTVAAASQAILRNRSVSAPLLTINRTSSITALSRPIGLTRGCEVAGDNPRAAGSRSAERPAPAERRVLVASPLQAAPSDWLLGLDSNQQPSG